jgi:hypothetical protein
MDWPPIGSSLLPAGGNARKDEVLEKRKSLDSGFFFCEVVSTIADPAFPGPVVSDDDPENRLSNNTSDAPRIWTLASPPLLTRFISERRVDISLTLGNEEVAPSSRQDCSRVTDASTSLASLDHVSERAPQLPSPPRFSDFALPVFPRITLPPISLPPTGIHNLLGRHIASSVPRNDHGETEIGSAAPDPVFVDLLSNARNGYFRSTGNVLHSSALGTFSHLQFFP